MRDGDDARDGDDDDDDDAVVEAEEAHARGGETFILKTRTTRTGRVDDDDDVRGRRIEIERGERERARVGVADG